MVMVCVEQPCWHVVVQRLLMVRVGVLGQAGLGHCARVVLSMMQSAMVQFSTGRQYGGEMVLVAV